MAENSSPDKQSHQGPLQEIGTNDRWRPSVSSEDGAKGSPVSKTKFSTPPANSPRAFWQRRDPMSTSPVPGSPSLGPLYDKEYSPTPSPMRRRSIERLKQASRVKNSSMFAREAKAEYDPASAPVSVERPLAAGRPFKVNNPALVGSPTMSPLPLSSRNQGSPSPTRSSLATVPRFGTKAEESPDRSPTLRRQPKSVTFDPAPQVKEFEMCTPDRSSVADSEASYESWNTEDGEEEDEREDDEYEYDYEYEEYGYGFGGDESFDASLEDTNKTPIVMPGDAFPDEDNDPDRDHLNTPDSQHSSVGGVDIAGGRHDNPSFEPSAAHDSTTRPLPVLPSLPSPDRRQSAGLSAVAERLSLTMSAVQDWPTRDPLTTEDILDMKRAALQAEKVAGLDKTSPGGFNMLSDDEIANLDPDQPIPSRESSSQYDGSVYSVGYYEGTQDRHGDYSAPHHALDELNPSFCRDHSEDDGDRTPRAGTPTQNKDSLVGVEKRRAESEPSWRWPRRDFSESENELGVKLPTDIGNMKLLDCGLGGDDFASSFGGLLIEATPEKEDKVNTDPVVADAAAERTATFVLSDTKLPPGGGRRLDIEDTDDDFGDEQITQASRSKANLLSFGSEHSSAHSSSGTILNSDSKREDEEGGKVEQHVSVPANYSGQSQNLASSSTAASVSTDSPSTRKNSPLQSNAPPSTSTTAPLDSYNTYSLGTHTPPPRQRSPDEESLHTPESVIHRRLSLDEWSQWSEDPEENPDLEIDSDDDVGAATAKDEVLAHTGVEEKSKTMTVPLSAATIRTPGWRLKTRPSLTGGDLNLAERMEKLSIGGIVSEPGSEERRFVPELLLNLPDPTLGLEDEFSRLIGGHKRGYLMRQNTKIVVASDGSRAMRGSRVDNHDNASEPNGSDTRKVSGPWTTEAWNGARRQSNRARGSAIGVSRMKSVPEDQTVSASSKPPNLSESGVEAKIPSFEEEPEDSAERGRLFVKVIGVQDMDLPFPDKTKEVVPFRLTVDNGLHCVTTGWKELGRTASVGQEFELTVGGELEFQLTLQMKLTRNPNLKVSSGSRNSADQPLPPVPDSPSKRSGLSRLLGSPRKKKIQPSVPPTAFSKSYAGPGSEPPGSSSASPSAYDLLHRLVSEDGSFARAYVCLKTHEAVCFGRPVTLSVPCFNEWALQDGTTVESSVRSKRGGIVRKPPYRVGRLLLGLMYVPKVRFNDDLGPLVADTLPRSMGAAVREVERVERLLRRQAEEAEKRKAEMAAAAKLSGHSHPSNLGAGGLDSSGLPSGFLTQLGGDCPYWRRRYFRLAGSKLTGYHEITRQPRATINLAKAVSLSDGRGKVKRRLSRRSEGSPAGQAAGNFEEVSGKLSAGIVNGADDDDVFVLVQHAFRIRFANGEAIDFSASSDEEKNKWLDWLSSVIGKKIPAPISSTVSASANQSQSANNESSSLDTKGSKAENATSFLGDEPPMSAWACLVIQREKKNNQEKWQEDGALANKSKAASTASSTESSRELARRQAKFDEAPGMVLQRAYQQPLRPPPQQQPHEQQLLNQSSEPAIPTASSSTLSSVRNSASLPAPAPRPSSHLNKDLPMPPQNEDQPCAYTHRQVHSMDQVYKHQQPQPNVVGHQEKEYARHHKSVSASAYPIVHPGSQNLPAGYVARPESTYIAYDPRVHGNSPALGGAVMNDGGVANVHDPARNQDRGSLQVQTSGLRSGLATDLAQGQDRGHSNFSTLSSYSTAATAMSGMTGSSASSATTVTSRTSKGVPVVTTGSRPGSGPGHRPGSSTGGSLNSRGQVSVPSQSPSLSHQGFGGNGSHTNGRYPILHQHHQQQQPQQQYPPSAFAHNQSRISKHHHTSSGSSAPDSHSGSVSGSTSGDAGLSSSSSKRSHSTFFLSLSPTTKAKREKERLAKEKEKEREREKDKDKDRAKSRLARSKVKSMLF